MKYIWALLVISLLIEIALEPLEALLRWVGWIKPEPKMKAQTGMEGLLDESAVVKSDFIEKQDPACLEGMVIVRGERWKAKLKKASSHSVKAGQTVKIVSVEGLTLLVELNEIE
jgi:membrane-bound ClpP family serine protease